MSQTTSILEYLKQGNSITALEALNSFQCMRLASRINDLKNMGYDVISTMAEVKSGKKVASYMLKSVSVKLLTSNTLIFEISKLLEKNPKNIKTKLSQLLHRAKAHINLHTNSILALELEEQVNIGFGFLNSGVLDIR